MLFALTHARVCARLAPLISCEQFEIEFMNCNINFIDRSNIGIAGSNPASGMDVCPRVSV
jgi:hypothetical protein